MLDETTVVGNFGIGQPVRRTEDPTLVRGAGRYADDVNADGQLYAAIVRSPVAHGLLRGVDLEPARAMPGVQLAFAAAELDAAGFGLLKCRFVVPNSDGTPMKQPERRALARDKVRFAGDPVACIIATSAVLARDAAEAVVLDIEQLPAVTAPGAAGAAGAPLVYDDVPGNLQLDYHFGDTAAVEAAFAGAAHRTRVALLNQRLVCNPMEPRAALARYDAETGYTLDVCSQGVVNMKTQLLNDILPGDVKVRVRTGNVGGSFGMKFAIYPEYVCQLYAAHQLGRPVKWTDDRSGAFLSDQHGRDHEVEAELALDADGRFLAVRFTVAANIGAYLSTVGTMIPTRNITVNGIGQYRTPLIEVTTRCYFTNTTPIGAYRGAGRPEANYFMERLIETAARETGRDPVALRRLNQIAPDALPYRTPSDQLYDSGEFSALMEAALAAADWDGFAARKAASEARGLLRGRGLGCFLEATAGPMPEMGSIRFEADGSITLISGTLDYGQGHAAAFAQVLASRLGVPFERIRLVQGDSDEVAMGSGSGGSRSIMNSGAYIVAAADEVIERGRQIAAHVLEAATEDMEFSGGRFTIAGTDRTVDLLDLAAQMRDGLALPADLPQTLDAMSSGPGMPAVYPNGAHVCELEIDPDTGVVQIDRYVAVNDFGTVINPMLVDGQLHGGIVQSIGQALMERTVYDDDGQLVSGSFMDYAIPHAPDVPAFTSLSRPTPATTNPLGAKGCGEAGCAGGLTAVMNALHDALAPLGVREIEMPATPPKLWRLIREARAAA